MLPHSSRRPRAVGALLLTTCLASVAAAARPGDASIDSPKNAPPNLVIIFIDDMGYSDIGPFGATAYATPNLDRMAIEGRKFTDFHSATAVCSASRAALMTGCYPERVSILGALRPKSREGISDDELTLAELCKQNGYATGIFGKWHLGDRRRFLPLQHGFDEYYGLPYSNDMGPFGPRSEPLPEGDPRATTPPTPIFEGNDVVDPILEAADQPYLTGEYTRRAVDFISRHHEQPFFLYVPHTMMHVPLFAGQAFRGKSGAGELGDVVTELDWSAGEILAALKKYGVDDHTLVIFTSDNGPWLRFGNHGGTARPLREGKGTMFEGGYRVPCLMRMPSRIPAGTTCDQFCTTLDILPTFASLLGVKLPADRVIDGHDIWPLMSGAPNAKTPWDVFYCYYGRELHAVRDQRWKLHFPHPYPTLPPGANPHDGDPAALVQATVGLELYDLEADVGETVDVAADHPDVVARLSAAAERARDDLGDVLTNRQGQGVRPPGRAGGRRGQEK